jgi:hypothetical protein
MTSKVVSKVVAVEHQEDLAEAHAEDHAAVEVEEHEVVMEVRRIFQMSQRDRKQKMSQQ